MLTYAEIDIRNHIYKQMILRSISLEDACSIVVDRYCLVIAEIESLGFKLLVNGPFGSGFGVPRVETKRLNRIAYIDQMLNSVCATKGWLYHSLCDVMVGSGFFINRGYFGEVDDNHLNKSSELKYFILASFLQQARKYYPRIESNSPQEHSKYLSLHFKTDSTENPVSTILSIDNKQFVCNSPSSCTYNQLLISLMDHVQVKRIMISLKTSNLHYKLGLR